MIDWPNEGKEFMMAVEDEDNCSMSVARKSMSSL